MASRTAEWRTTMANTRISCRCEFNNRLVLDVETELPFWWFEFIKNELINRMKFNRSIFLGTSGIFSRWPQIASWWHDPKMQSRWKIFWWGRWKRREEKAKEKEKRTRDERRKAMAMNEQPYNLTFWHFLYPRHYLNMNKYSSDTKFSLNKKRNYCYLFCVATTT